MDLAHQLGIPTTQDRAHLRKAALTSAAEEDVRTCEKKRRRADGRKSADGGSDPSRTGGWDAGLTQSFLALH
eukprot:gene15307-5333_t